MNMQFRELAALYSFFFYDNVENQSKYPIKFAIFNEEVGKIFPSLPPPIKCKAIELSVGATPGSRLARVTTAIKGCQGGSGQIKLRDAND